MATLNEKQTRFVAEFLKDFNASKAAERAGYSPKTAYSLSWRLLKNVEIQAELTRHREAALAEGAMQFDEAVRVLSQIARGRIADYLTKDNRIDLDRVRDTNPAAVQFVKSSENHTVIRMRDPIQAIERLAKLLGWDKPQKVESDQISAFIGWVRAQGRKDSPAQ